MSANLTSRYGWSVPGAVVTEDDTLVTADAGTMKAANIPAGAYQPDKGQNAVEIAWSMPADGDSCVAYVFAARNQGDIVLVWSGTITAGTQVATDGRLYIDTIATTTDNWITGVNLVDESGSNRQARIIFDTCGYKTFFCQYTGLGETETVKSYYSGY